MEEYGEQYQQEVRVPLPSVGSSQHRWRRAVSGVMPVVVPVLTSVGAAARRRGVPCWPFCGPMQTTHRSTTRCCCPPGPQTVGCCPTPGHRPRGWAEHIAAHCDSVTPGQSGLTSDGGEESRTRQQATL